MRKVIAGMLFALALICASLLVVGWNKVDAHGHRLAVAQAAFVVMFGGSGLALLLPASGPLHYLRRILASVALGFSLLFALHMRTHWATSLQLALAFATIAAALLFVPSRNKPRPDVTTS